MTQKSSPRNKWLGLLGDNSGTWNGWINAWKFPGRLCLPRKTLRLDPVAILYMPSVQLLGGAFLQVLSKENCLGSFQIYFSMNWLWRSAAIKRGWPEVQLWSIWDRRRSWLEGIYKLPRVWKLVWSDLKERAIHKTRLPLGWGLRLVYTSGVTAVQTQLTIIHQ